MSIRLREPWDHPWKEPYLPAWGGHYEHAFVALHPFYKDQQAPWVGAVGWAEVARACGSPPFAKFARALWDASYYKTDADPVLDRLDLSTPADSTLNEALVPDCCRMFRALGVETVRLRDNLVKTEAEVPLATLEADPWAVHAEALAAHATAMFDADHRLIVSTRPRSDWQWSVVALKQDALSALGGRIPLEGFPAGLATGDIWIDEPGTYSYPDWLREATDAA